jgi:hypothetical protein
LWGVPDANDNDVAWSFASNFATAFHLDAVRQAHTHEGLQARQLASPHVLLHG